MRRSSLGPEYFDAVYARSDDPWDFRTSAYERAKYEKTLEALQGGRFRRALEIGCSVGELTRMLAARCEVLESIDVNERALENARVACASFTNVHFARMQVPAEFPSGRFDLVVLSEVAYYWSDDDLESAKRRIAVAAGGGTLELVHFLPPVNDYVRDGDAVHDSFIRDPRFAVRHSLREARYRIDVLDVSREAPDVA